MSSDFGGLVSVVVPIYNASSTLEECIGSLIGQTYKEIEVLLIDDGSTDNSPTICQEYADRFQIFRIIHKENGGVSSARNSGIEVARGDYIVFIDSDDAIEPFYIESLVSKLKDYRCDIVVDGFSIESKGCRKNNTLSFVGAIDTEEIKNHIKEMVDKKVFLSVWGKLYSKKIIDYYNIQFDENISTGEDMLFNCRYFEHVKKLYSINGCGYIYRIGVNPHSLTHEFGLERIEKTEELLRHGNHFCNKMNLNEEAITSFVKYYFRSHLITLERICTDINYWHNRNQIRDVLCRIRKQELYKKAVKYRSKDIELLVYQKIFSGPPLIVFCFCLCRHGVKTIIQGY